MIHYLENTDIDYTKWDRCIATSENGRIYARSWYLDAVAPNWNALVLDDYRAVMPISERRRFGIRYVYPPFWAQQLGVFSVDSEDYTRAFLEALSKRFLFSEMYLNAGNRIEESFKPILKNNFELDLNRSYQSIYEGYQANTRRNIDKSKNSGLTLFRNDTPDAIIHLFRANKGEQLEHLIEDDYHRLKHLLYAGMHRGVGQTYSVYDESNTQLAGAYFMFEHNRLVFLFSGQSEYGKERRALYFLLDEVIIEHAGHPLLLDFEGSSIPGLARFYEGFGAANVPYPYIRINRLPWPFNLLKK
jgi:hypothetical protein